MAMAQAALAAPLELPPHWTQQAWMDEAACRGQTALFFPPLAERPQARARREVKAKAICLGCPVMVQCRVYARVHREYGYWGAESEEERAVAGYSVPSPIGGRARRRREQSDARPSDATLSSPVPAGIPHCD